MKILFVAVIALLAGIPIGCSAQPTTEAKSPPTGLLVDCFGGIYWARAPVGYYTGDGAESIKRYMKKARLDDTETPLFKVSADAIKRVYSITPSEDRKSEAGRMTFLFIFFCEDGSSIKRSVLKDDLKKAIDILPANATARLVSMYEIADKINKPN